MTDQHRCPHCGWPARELPADSVHASSRGRLSYRRCLCGSWLLELDGVVLGATRTAAPRR
ncbi:hypothetical protein ABZ863_04215 [Saccharomonospora sp. NPDC046836]|uniref:hypothetical protein n=1 Tax=Saccharomonospora sp. NPDC046836 TaxID=3156921 RepID=UPI0033DC99FE